MSCERCWHLGADARDILAAPEPPAPKLPSRLLFNDFTILSNLKNCSQRLKQILETPLKLQVRAPAPHFTQKNLYIPKTFRISRMHSQRKSYIMCVLWAQPINPGFLEKTLSFPKDPAKRHRTCYVFATAKPLGTQLSDGPSPWMTQSPSTPGAEAGHWHDGSFFPSWYNLYLQNIYIVKLHRFSIRINGVTK